MTGPRSAPWRRSRAAFLASLAARFVLATLVLLVAVSVLPRVAGWQSSVVMSGSMAPTLEPGDVVVVRPVAAAGLTPGRIVLVDDPDAPGELRLHRIAAVEHGELRLRGDANPQDDSSLVAVSAVHGAGALRLPFLGLPVVWAAGGDVVPLLLAAAGLAAIVGLALLHRPDDEDHLPGPDAGRRACAPFRLRPRRSRRTVSGTARVVALAGVAVVLAGLPGAAPARAVFSSISGTPSSSLTAGTYFSCAAATSAAGATQYYPLQETGGTTAADNGTLGSAANATYSSTGVTYGAAGPDCSATQHSAVTLDGASGAIAAVNAVTNPTTFSVQIWFSTTTTSGGKLIGFGSSTTGASGNYDRHIYMLNGGQLSFGVYDGSATHVITSVGAYNDGNWHLATATFSGTAGMTLYVDGGQVGRDATSKTAQNFTGYWRIGYDSLGNWPNTPTSAYFAGSVAHAAVFPSVLSAAEAAAQFGAGPWTCAAAAGSNGAGAVQSYGLQETGGATAANAGTAGSAGNGSYASTGVTYNRSGPACGTNADAAVRLDGAAGQIWTTRAVTNPQWLTVQIWFSTTSTTGGKLIGFGNNGTGGSSSSYDRHLFMSNNGTVTFGVFNSGYYTVASSTAYNDGSWHLATGTFSPGTGLRLYVDGVLIGTNTQTTAAENYTGYWRIGYDNLGGWPGQPSSLFFSGKLAYAAVFDRVLTTDEIAGQYLAGK